jgi:glyoxalase family protein
MTTVHGLHHVTAIASDPQRNLDFFTRALGLRLIKLTVNFDDPGTYHFYFGDKVGTPGSVLTYFPWPHGTPAPGGPGQATEMAFAIPQGALGFWADRLKALDIPAGESRRFDEPALVLADPDGIAIRLVESAGELGPIWEADGIPAEKAIRGFHSVALSVARPDATEAVLTGLLGFERGASADGTTRVTAGGGGATRQVDLMQVAAGRARMAPGTIHHVAFRATDDADQATIREQAVAAGLRVTPVMDRQYFRSIYFNEPSGVLFEVATDGPGFATDESVDSLGSRLRLPPWLEPKRADIEAIVPPLALPAAR